MLIAVGTRFHANGIGDGRGGFVGWRRVAAVDDGAAKKKDEKTAGRSWWYSRWPGGGIAV